MGYTGVVHTKSSYAGENIELNTIPKQTNLNSQISFLRKKENDVYSRLIPGCNSIEQFVIELRKIFQNSEEDSKVFRFFENANIKQALVKKFGSTTKKQQEIIITINSNGEEIDFAEMLQGTSAKIESSGRQSKINLGVDIKQIKKSINRLFATRLNEESGNKKRLNELLSNNSLLADLLKVDSDEIFSVESSGKIQSERFGQRILVPGSIFSYTADDIHAAIALGEESELYKQLDMARQEVYNFIIEYSGYNQASNEMRQAVDNVWKRNIEGNLTNLALFEKGGALNLLAGAFGEFQGALLTEYVNLKVKGSAMAQSLIADTLKSGEQAKADVTFLGNIGIQVKNYNPYSAERGYSMLDINTHPGKLVQFPSFSMNSTSFLDFLANYYFNKTYQEENESTFLELEEVLQTFYAEVANLAITEEVGDLVTFYFIEGSHFVPGSYILEGLRDQQLSTDPITIKGPSIAKYDEEFNNTEIRQKSRKESLFSKWWTKSSASGWHPKNPQNTTTYSNLINKQISIYSKFNYRDITIKNRFSLF